MDELIGRTLKGKFRITAHIGEGAMGSVYRGVETETGRDVAVKIMRPSMIREPGMLTRFRREATAMRRVRHPNAVEVFAYGVDDGLVFLAMELVVGADLADRIAIERRLAPERAARVVADVCGALAEAHAHGVVHRDIKPENVMLGGPSGDTVKLIDFGIAKPTGGRGAPIDTSEDDRSIDDSIPDSVDLANDFELTTAGTVVGSPGYMAPEQWTGKPVDARTDIYACGVLLYQLVTGRLPIEEDNPFLLATRQRDEAPAPPHELNAAVPESLSAIILRALRPEPADRWQSAKELGDALCTFLVERSIVETIQLGATLPFDIASPMAPAGDAAPSLFGGTLILDAPPAPPGKTLPLPDEWAPTQPMPVLFPETPAEAAPSIARNGRKTPVPAAPLARRPAPRADVTAPRARVLIPLAAAFLALGLAVGILLFFPAL